MQISWTALSHTMHSARLTYFQDLTIRPESVVSLALWNICQLTEILHMYLTFTSKINRSFHFLSWNIPKCYGIRYYSILFDWSFMKNHVHPTSGQRQPNHRHILISSCDNDCNHIESQQVSRRPLRLIIFTNIITCKLSISYHWMICKFWNFFY